MIEDIFGGIRSIPPCEIEGCKNDSRITVYMWKGSDRALTNVCLGCYEVALKSITGFQKFQKEKPKAFQLELQWKDEVSHG